MDFKDNNPMRVETDGAKNIRRPVSNAHIPLENEGDEDVEVSPKTPPKPRVAKPPKAGTATSPPGSPPPPPPARQKSGKPSREETKDGHGDVELHAVDLHPEKPHSTKEERVRSEKKSPKREPSTKAASKDAAAAKEGGGGGGGGAARESKGKEDPSKSRFVGRNLVQYGLWAHYLAYGAACMCLCMGAFAMAWTDAHTYHCRVNGDLINSVYLFTSTGTCPTTYTNNGVTKNICCDPKSKTGIRGFLVIGAIYVAYGLLIFLWENTEWGFGLWFPNDHFFYRNKISLISIAHVITGVVGLYNYATCLAGAFLITTGVVYQYAVMRFESGDGGRALRAKQRENAKKTNTEVTLWSTAGEYCAWAYRFNIITFFRRIYNEDKLSSYIWVTLFFGANIALFFVTLVLWINTVKAQIQDLQDGTLKVDCGNRLCHTNRKIVRYGPFSVFAAIAKSFGALLNFNSALILFPVTKLLLRKLNNSGVSFNAVQGTSDYFGKFFARPLTRYVPLSKNIEFHKLVAGTIFVSSWGHLIGHLLNLIESNNATMAFFRLWSWQGTNYLTGAIVSFSMFMIYTAAPDIVRMTKFEIFFNSHHFFVVYFLVMFIHGPVFFYWTCIPVLLYILERYLQTYRGNRPYQVVKVEWIPPVMAIYFRPVFREDFPFKEGQYLYLNCPYVSASEWHPFTISSAVDDMSNGPRIHLETGEEVVEVPRPKHLPANAKWNKYCLVSKDWTAMDPNDYLDKSETGYFDFISVHVKVHGLEEPTARTWTRKLKEYFELMSPGKKFPFYFYKRDQRGDITVGRQNGPDGTQILRVDGPHSAPSEHYTNYGTVMLIGAGIGLTPCASVICALTKYRWKKNFNPELLHFYWVVRQNEMDSFQWLVHMLTELSYELKKGRANGQIDRKYYCEINIYVTGVEKTKKEVLPLHRPKKVFYGSSCTPTFTADELYAKLLNPTVDSKGQVKKMKEGGPNAENRLQDIWIWNGRPHWDEVFKEMKDQRQHSDIGVCFCGAPVIGADLRSMCEKHSSVEEECLFTLHKENF